MIPRPETEILTEYVLEEIKNSGKNNIKILEIGTGSGCIPIALSGELSKLNISHHIDSFDVSSGAIKLAKKNAEINKINILNINFTVENLFNSKIIENIQISHCNKYSRHLEIILRIILKI